MSIYRKVQSVERVFRKLDKEVATFQQATGLGCVSGCGRCCQKPDINATVLEFFPFAYHLYKTNQAEAMYDHIKKNEEANVCLLFSPFIISGSTGFCSQYAYRGLICRLFGFSAMTNKHGDPKLVTCKPIKEEKAEAFAKANQHVENHGTVPMLNNYYHQIRSIDPVHGQLLIPINQAILLAIEHVLTYYFYRSPRKAG